MTKGSERRLHRRDLLGWGLTGVAATVVGSQPLTAARGFAAGDKSKRRARYQPTSPEIRNFYRVNRYPAR